MYVSHTSLSPILPLVAVSQTTYTIKRSTDLFSDSDRFLEIGGSRISKLSSIEKNAKGKYLIGSTGHPSWKFNQVKLSFKLFTCLVV